MTSIFKKAILGTALAATAMAAMPATASADEWHHRHDGDGAGIAIAAGVIGLIAGVAIASGHHHDQYYDTEAAAYPGQASCYEAYPGYSGYCYPSSYYVNQGWGYRDGGWWYGGSRYARPYVIGGYRGGYGNGYGNGYGGDYRGGYTGGGWHGRGRHCNDEDRGDWGDDR